MGSNSPHKNFELQNIKPHILFFLLLILLITFTSAIARATDVKLAKAKIPLIANPQQTNSQAPATRARKSNLKSQVAKTHIPFIANQGQVDGRVKYYAQTFGGTVFVTDKGEIVYLMPKSGTENAIVLKEELLDRAHAAVEGEAKTRTRVSYLKGKDPSRWKKNLSTYGAVSLGEVHPGIRMTLKARANNVEKLFFVQPGADAGQIRLTLTGAEALRVNEQEELEVITGSGTVKFSKPLAFQNVEGRRKSVDVVYALDGHTYGFKLGEYDHSRELVIDPALASTFLGGSSDEVAGSLVFDGNGDLYVLDSTASADFPTTAGAYGTVYTGGSSDAYVAKLTGDLSTLLAATFFGGSSTERPMGMGLDSAGNVFIFGSTDSGDIPTTIGAYDTTKDLYGDLFIAKFDAGLGTLLASTYLGGNANDGWCCGGRLLIDGNDDVFVTSISGGVGNNYPTTLGAYDRTYNDYNTDDVVISKLDNNLTTLLASTFLGGYLWDVVNDATLDAAGNVYVVGRTSSSNYPTTAGAYHGDYGDPWPYYDGFISKLNNTLTTLLASTYLGSSGFDILWDIDVAPDGRVYVSGSTTSSAFPTTAGAYDTTYNGGEDGFIAKLDANFTTLLASTFLGGSGVDRAVGVVLDGAGNVHVGGNTSSSDLPTTLDGLSPSHNGGTYDGLYFRFDGSLSAVQYGTYVGGSNNDATYRPAMNAAGDIYLYGYTLSPDFPSTASAYDPTHNGGMDGFVMRLGSLNGPPTADDKSVSTDEDAAVAFNLTGSDPDGDPLTFSVLSGPAHGALSGTAPNLTYTPDPAFNGADSFTFKANDGTVDSNVATVSITVNPVNDAPLAANDSYNIDEDTTLNVAAPAVLGNDTDIDSASLTAVLVSLPSHGTLALNPNGSFSYTPAINYNGPDSFTYKANDGLLDSNVATVNITVNAVNDAPVAQNQSVTTDEDMAKAIVLGATDVDGDTLSFTVVTGPSNGSLSGAAPNLTYTPVANFNGSDSFTYRANDGTADSNVATVTITVNAVNDVPVAVNDSYSTPEDTALTVAVPGVLSNDTDADVNPLTAILVAGPTQGALILNANGSFTYTPNTNYNNGPDSFTYKANDGAADSNIATVSIIVNAVNDVPTANNQEVTTPEDTSVLITLTGSDIEGSALEFQITSGPSHGTLGEVTVTGPTTATVTYTPALNFNGIDSFLFTVDDGTNESPAATIMITVSSVNDGPTANNQAVTTDEDTSVAITLTGSDPENNPLTFTVETPPAKGSLNGSPPNMTYIPNPNSWGTDSFTFTVSDGSITSAPATITITVNPVNDVPTAIGFSETTSEDTPVTLTLLGSDPEGDPLTFSIVGEPSNGTLGPVTGSSVTYTPNPNFSGVDSFTFSASDGSSISTPATVMITVTPALDPRAAIAALIAQVDGLNLNRGQKQSLRKKLEAADRSLVRGRRNAAIHELEAFIREVRALQRSRRLDPPTASSLIVQAQQIIEMLTEETVAIAARDAARAEINRAIAKVGASDRRVIRAQRRFDRGLAAMDRDDFRRAAREFGLALRIAQRI